MTEFEAVVNNVTLVVVVNGYVDSLRGPLQMSRCLVHLFRNPPGVALQDGSRAHSITREDDGPVRRSGGGRAKLFAPAFACVKENAIPRKK
jgi:hypothetical protein